MDQVLSDIRSLILHLFQIYGKITPQQLSTRYDNVEKIEYNLEEPTDIIFDAVEDLLEIGELSGRPYSAQQIFDLGCIILSKNRIFRSDIRKWVRKPEDKITWTNFKSTFVEAHQELRDTDASIVELGFHSENEIVD